MLKCNLNASAKDVERPWFAFAMRNPLIMHVTLALSGGHWQASVSSPDVVVQREAYFQKGEAMRIVNERLQSLDAAQRLAPDVLTAVACLANVEVCHRDAPECYLWELCSCRLHRAGLPGQL